MPAVTHCAFISCWGLKEEKCFKVRCGEDDAWSRRWYACRSSGGRVHSVHSLSLRTDCTLHQRFGWGGGGRRPCARQGEARCHEGFLQVRTWRGRHLLFTRLSIMPFHIEQKAVAPDGILRGSKARSVSEDTPILAS
jgi:hypothetical protein